MWTHPQMTLFYSPTRALICPQMRYRVWFLSVLLAVFFLQRKVRAHRGSRNLPCRSPGLKSLILHTQRPCEDAISMCVFPFASSLSVLSGSAVFLSKAQPRRSQMYLLLAPPPAPGPATLIHIEREETDVLQLYVFSVK